MAIPGLKANYEVRAKVRIGEKSKTAGGKEFPKSVDYFICDDPEVPEGKPRELRIRFPFATADENWSTGLEFWRGKQLTCYSKGEPVPQQAALPGKTTAYRVNSMLDDFIIVGEPMGRGKERTPIACPFRTCPNFEARDCKPMARLQFFIEGGRIDAVLQFETKSWNTIEGIEATLAAATQAGDLRGRTFLLSVRMEQKANQKFPVVSLREETVNIDSPDDVSKADAYLALHRSLEIGDIEGIRKQLMVTLDVTNVGWRDKPEFIARIKEIGAVEAAERLLEKANA